MSSIAIPPYDSIKLNVDGSLFSKLNKLGVVAVVRDNIDYVLIGMCNVINRFCAIETLE